MQKWAQLFIRFGWLAQVEEDRIVLPFETKESIEDLHDVLIRAQASFLAKEDTLIITSPVVSEAAWIEALDERIRGGTQTIFYSNAFTKWYVADLDIYMAGFIRQLHRFGFWTKMSCDGHEEHDPFIVVVSEPSQFQALQQFLKQLAIPFSYKKERFSNDLKLSLHVPRHTLLDAASFMSALSVQDVAGGYQSVDQQQFAALTELMLSVDGESGHEDAIRTVVQQLLMPYVDSVVVDAYGNLLAEKSFTSIKQGPTVLLNAHLDTVASFARNRRIVKDGPIWSSSAGILGADDRAGIAIILHVLKFLRYSRYQGTVKLAFTVEEEIGLCGAQQVDDAFLADVDMAIVVDRRGDGHIVTSCAGVIPFCHPKYGRLFERVAKNAQLPNWHVTEGGSSDTRIWAAKGINSVNLSAGYMHEHSAAETLNIDAAYNTVQLLQKFFLSSAYAKQACKLLFTP